MILNTLRYFYNLFDFQLSRIFLTKNWKFKSILFFIFLVFFTSYPKYGLVRHCLQNSTNNTFHIFETEQKITNDEVCVFIEAISLQIKDPFKKLGPEFYNHYNYGSHLKKRWSRIVFPFIAHVLHLNYERAIVLAYLFNVLFIYVIVSFVHQISNNKKTAFYAGLAFSSVNVLIYGFHDFVYWDVSGYLFSSLLFLRRNLIYTFCFTLICLFCDERTVIPITFSIYYWGFVQGSLKSSAFYYQVFSSAIACLVYILLKNQLAIAMGIEPDYSEIGIKFFYQNINIIPLAHFISFEFLLVLVFFSLLYLIYSKEYISLFVFCLLIVSMTLFLPFIVFDISRSVNYCYPMILISISILQKKENIEKLMFYLAFACLLMPNYYIMFGKWFPEWLMPIFLRKLL